MASLMWWRTLANRRLWPPAESMGRDGFWPPTLRPGWPHETVALQMVYDHRTISARYCPSCHEVEDAARRDPIYRRYLEHPTRRISLDVVGLLTAALLRYSPDSN